MAHSIDNESEIDDFSDNSRESDEENKESDSEESEELRDLVHPENQAFFEMFGESDGEDNDFTGFQIVNLDWKRIPPTGEDFCFTTGPTGPTAVFDDGPSQFKCFELFSKDEVWDLLVARTNKRAKKERSTEPNKHHNALVSGDTARDEGLCWTQNGYGLNEIQQLHEILASDESSYSNSRIWGSNEPKSFYCNPPLTLLSCGRKHSSTRRARLQQSTQNPGADGYAKVINKELNMSWKNKLLSMSKWSNLKGRKSVSNKKCQQNQSRLGSNCGLSPVHAMVVLECSTCTRELSVEKYGNTWQTEARNANERKLL